MLLERSAQPVTVLDIQRMSTEDGPGLRTTLFMKGCTLRCDWCHNPESIDSRPLIQWNSHRCIGCDSCREVCESGALVHDQAEGRVKISGSSCTLCQACVECCPSGALHLKGEQWDREELLKELLKDRAYFGREGGITLSGGEPLLQAEAALWLLENIRREGLKTALDTAGLVQTEALLAALEQTDLLLYDLKIFDSEEHRKYTGSGNEQILANLVAALAKAGQSGTKVWIRTPLVPGVTDQAENVAGLARWLATFGTEQIERWELCAFNNLCENKYLMLDRDWPYRGLKPQNRAELDRLVEVAHTHLSGREILVQWTGSAALEKEDERGEL
jgi:pyruvate formate lyase activating enzyme